ncbi:hypothetical protein [Flavobacterium rhizosphaerae]|uniref:Uncharacterized protein n=1 Tax=Flavobacterium rhizosphaerae TaxID=3163298 RepID=A0ABW8YXF7_9FLAO
MTILTDKTQLVKFTRLILGAEVTILILLPVVLILFKTDYNLDIFYPVILFGSAFINLALLIAVLLVRPKFFWLYSLLLVTIPAMPVILLLWAMAGVSC